MSQPLKRLNTNSAGVSLTTSRGPANTDLLKFVHFIHFTRLTIILIGSSGDIIFCLFLLQDTHIFGLIGFYYKSLDTHDGDRDDLVQLTVTGRL